MRGKANILTFEFPDRMPADKFRKAVNATTKLCEAVGKQWCKDHGYPPNSIKWTISVSHDGDSKAEMDTKLTTTETDDPGEGHPRQEMK